MNADVFVQRVDPIGQRLWQEDQSAIATDHFFIKEGLVRSIAVDTTNANITRVYLMAQVELRGGTIKFFLSNDDGAIWTPVQPGVAYLFATSGSALRWQAKLVADSNTLSTSPEIDELAIVYEVVESCNSTTFLPLIQH